MATVNFNIRELLTTDLYDELVVSDAMKKADSRLGSKRDILVTVDAPIVLLNGNPPDDDVANMTLRIYDQGGVLTGPTALNFPAGIKGRWFVQNLTAQTLNASVGGVAAAVPTLTIAEVLSDGVDMFLLGSDAVGGGGGSSAIHYDPAFFFKGSPQPGAVVTQPVWIRSLVLRAGMPLSQGSCAVGPTVATSWPVQKNGVPVGSVDFAIAATVATFTAASNVSFVAGDVLQIVAPTPQDATQSNVGIMLHLEKL